MGLCLLLLLSWELRVAVRGADGLPLAGAAVRVSGAAFESVVRTTTDGVARVSVPGSGPYRISVAHEGYHELARSIEAPADIEFTLTPIERRLERVSVEAPAGSIEQPPAASVRELPQRPATVREALPLIPGVARTIEGKLIISDAAEHRSTLLVNSLDATDPATGKFGATIPIDAVAAFNVYKNPFLAEYGRFTTGVVTVETRRASDQWRWVLNDPTPELRIRSGRLRGIRGFTPRLSAGGPLESGSFYLWQSLEYRFKETPIRTQPFPRNEQRTQGWNSLTQLDWVISAKHLAGISAHVVPQRLDFVNLSLYNPQGATAGFRGSEWMVGASDRLGLAGGWLENAISFGRVTARTQPQGEEGLTMFPDRNAGHYPFRQHRHAQRAQWRGSYAAAPLAGHHLKVGGWLMRTSVEGLWRANPIRVHDLSGRLLREIVFFNHPGFRRRDWETSWFAHDQWALPGQLSVNLGLRGDTQSLAGAVRLAPRFSVAWSPRGDSSTVLRAGYGWFYDRVPLNVFAFSHYPEWIEDRKRPNVLDSGRLSPRARVWSAEWEQQLRHVVQLRARYTDSRASNLIVLRPASDRMRLTGEGRARSRHLEILSRLRLSGERELLASYVHGRTCAHLNDFAEFLGDFAPPVIRPDAYATAPGNIPHRFLLWGTLLVSEEITPQDGRLFPLSPAMLQAARGWRLAPVIEYRTGFPFAPLDATQNYAEPPNRRRFPNFFSLDLRLSKDIPAGGKRTARVSFSCFNLTNHFNPDSVRWNVADPQFGEFLGQHPRRFRLDFDIYF